MRSRGVGSWLPTGLVAKALATAAMPPCAKPRCELLGLTVLVHEDELEVYAVGGVVAGGPPLCVAAAGPVFTDGSTPR